ncbi:MAG TPA: tetratricopeptide repeat protein [Anaeromyxobacteraceae bacterium]|nr:tetratricopeptide repeat protein [Anaeromyxobacteraceae bacterium]
MARSEHHDLTRKELKGPDWFLAKATGVAAWAGQNQKRIAVGLGGALAVLGVALGASAWMDERETKAGAMLYRTLEAVDGEVSGAPLPGLGRKVFATASDKDRAVVAAAAEVLQAYPSSQAARTAALAAGDAHLRLGEWDAALESYQRFLAGGPADDSLRFAALEGLALAREGKGELELAARDYQRLGVEAAAHKDRAALEQARVLARAGKREEARAILKRFPEEFKDSPLRPEAEERLRRLGAG